MKNNLVENQQNNEILKKIFFELSCAMDGLGEDLLSQILSQFGHNTNQDILQQLCEFNLDFDANLGKEEDIAYKRKFLFIGSDFTIETVLLKSLEKIVIEGEYGGTKSYGILINRDVNSKMFYANKKIMFKSEKERNREFAKIKKHLETFNVIFK